jgi:phosphatidylglycerophosphate synthase
MVFSVFGAGLIYWVGLWDRGYSPLALWVAAFCVQMRLLCNLLDGVIAVELRMGSPTGELYNEVPDRVADTVFLISIGWASAHRWGIELAWAAAFGAILTAYIRVLGKACGTPAYFWGPMAKPHRMALLTAVLVVAPVLSGPNRLMLYLGFLGVVAALSVFTAWRRLVGVARALNEGTK